MHKSLCSHLVDVCEISSFPHLPSSLFEEVCILLILLLYFLLLQWQISQMSFCTNSFLHSPLSSHLVPFCPYTSVHIPARLQDVLLKSLLQAASTTETFTLCSTRCMDIIQDDQGNNNHKNQSHPRNWHSLRK